MVKKVVAETMRWLWEWRSRTRRRGRAVGGRRRCWGWRGLRRRHERNQSFCFWLAAAWSKCRGGQEEPWEKRFSLSRRVRRFTRLILRQMFKTTFSMQLHIWRLYLSVHWSIGLFVSQLVLSYFCKTTLQCMTYLVYPLGACCGHLLQDFPEIQNCIVVHSKCFCMKSSQNSIHTQIWSSETRREPSISISLLETHA